MELERKAPEEGPRYLLIAREDDMVVTVIGTGPLVGYHKIGDGECAHPEHWGQMRDHKFSLDKGGIAWMHEAEDFIEERRAERHIGTRTVIYAQREQAS